MLAQEQPDGFVVALRARHDTAQLGLLVKALLAVRLHGFHQ
jgi:hypothetical protein